MYLPVPYKVLYDTSAFPFKEIVENILEVNDLTKLHEHEKIDLLVREKDQSTKWHKSYYEKFNKEFRPIYEKFVKHIASVFCYSEIIYQKIPTFRAHLVENLGVGEWHKDSTYNHGTTEVNFWMPFVNTNEQNTIWMESKEDKGDYRPYKVNYGEILVFSGANLYHGNKNNDSNQTRVSVDFRLVDPAKFIPNEAGSINMKAKFDVGGYFEKL